MVSMIGGIRNSPKASRRLRGPHNMRVVFTIDLTSADGLFSARNPKRDQGLNPI
jgi:hypothetical protein